MFDEERPALGRPSLEPFRKPRRCAGISPAQLNWQHPQFFRFVREAYLGQLRDQPIRRSILFGISYVDTLWHIATCHHCDHGDAPGGRRSHGICRRKCRGSVPWASLCSLECVRERREIEGCDVTGPDSVPFGIASGAGRGPGLTRRSTVNAIALLLYVVVSVACVNAANYPSAKWLIHECWSWVWLLGPPVTLIYQTEYWWVYGSGTALLVSLVIVAEVAWKRWPGLTLTCLGLAIVVWCLSGVLVYAPIA
jgi:hypothetical protein